MRVHELSKELGVGSKNLVALAKKLGSQATTHMSLIEDEVVAKLRAQHSAKPAAAKTKAAPAVAAAPAKVAAKTAAPAQAAKKTEVKTPPPAAPVKKEATVTVVKSSAPEKKIEPAEPVKIEPVKAEPPQKLVEVSYPITVGKLAEALSMRIPELIKALMGIGIFANVNQLLNEEIVQGISRPLNVNIQKSRDVEDEIIEKFKSTDVPERLKPRPPVVTMMGHVDHGKTSLLDAIRKTNVAAREKGFITQHIGAYGVEIPGKGHVTFLDTPGHEAFTAMRARGANVTDVVVLVVAADDGVMPQTVEAIDHAREAKCPIIVAINKTDLPAADATRVMTGLQKYDLVAEEWGGKTLIVKVSAKTGKGIDELLDLLLLESEVLELKANPDCPARGTVIESHLSKGSGPVATIIVQSGTLKVGDMIVSGPYMGRVRSLRNDLGKNVKAAGPSFAAEVSGLNGVPEAGETLFVVHDEKAARGITEKRVLEQREREMRGTKHLSLEDLYHRISEGAFKELKIIIKADVQGSMEALKQSLEKLSTDKCGVRVIHGGMGGVNESDIVLAAASDAVILAFHVTADPNAEKRAGKEGVDIRFYHIIYEAVEEVRKAMEGLLEPTFKEVIEGKASIRKTFKVGKAHMIGGAMIIKGRIVRNNRVRVVREHVVLFDGKLSSLKRFKDDVREVAQGYECGMAFEGFHDLREGDTVESYRLEKIASTL